MKFINKIYALETQNKTPKKTNEKNVSKILNKKLCNHKKSKLIKLNYISHIPQSINIPYNNFFTFYVVFSLNNDLIISILMGD